MVEMRLPPESFTLSRWVRVDKYSLLQETPGSLLSLLNKALNVRDRQYAGVVSLREVVEAFVRFCNSTG